MHLTTAHQSTNGQFDCSCLCQQEGGGGGGKSSVLVNLSVEIWKNICQQEVYGYNKHNIFLGYKISMQTGPRVVSTSARSGP